MYGKVNELKKVLVERPLFRLPTICPSVDSQCTRGTKLAISKLVDCSRKLPQESSCSGGTAHFGIRDSRVKLLLRYGIRGKKFSGIYGISSSIVGYRIPGRYDCV